MTYLRGQYQGLCPTLLGDKCPEGQWTNTLCMATFRRRISDAAESKYEVPNDEPVEGEEVFFQRPMVEVKAKLPHYVSAPRNHSSDTRPKAIHNTVADETLVHFWKTGPRDDDMLERSTYQRLRCIPSCDLLWTIDMNKIPQLQKFVDLYGLDVAVSVRR